MHKCTKCGQEYEGNFCPNCGAGADGSVTCPNCGTKITGDIKFCPNCGSSLTGENAKNAKKGGFDFAGWFKAHLKIIIPLLLAAVLAIVLGCTIPACIKAADNGTYYKVIGGEVYTGEYYTLKSGKWTNELNLSGTYKKSGDKIVFYFSLFGMTEEIPGTIKDYVLTLGNDTYISEKHKHSYGEWSVTKEATCTEEGSRYTNCPVCKQKITEVIEKLQHDIVDATDSENHWTECSVCKTTFSEKEAHDTVDNCKVCGYPFVYEYDFNRYILKGFADGAKTNTTANIPQSFKNLPITSIGDWAFYGCDGLTSITIPDSVTSIGEYAFYYCSGLTSVTIPDSVTSIGNYAFKDTAYYNDENNWEDEVLYIGKHLIEAKDTISGSYSIKQGTLTIADSAFVGCDGLTSITIPDSVTDIEDRAFWSCRGLTSVTIGNGVTFIDDDAFSYCFDLKDIYYSGTKEDWKKIIKNFYIGSMGNYTVHCSDGDLTKAESNS